MIKYIDFGGVAEFEEYETDSSTVFGSPNARGASAVGAAYWQNTPALGNLGANPPLLNESSSAGGTPILFDTQGNRLATPEIRQAVDITGPDGVSTTMAGFSPFFGTSAAAPHVAGVAALMLQAAGGPGSLTPTQLYSILETTAIDIFERVDPLFPSTRLSIPGGDGYDLYSGFGLVDALAAVRAVTGTTPPTPPQPPFPPVVQVPGVIQGVKWYDRNGNGNQDLAEQGLAGWTIFADLDRDGRLDSGEPSAVTGEGGAYRLSNLPPTTYWVSEVAVAGWEQTFPSTGHHTVAVGSGQTVTDIDFGNRQIGGTIVGRMWNDLSGDGQQDEGDPGVAGLLAYVDLDQNGVHSLSEPSGISDARGAYRITGVPEGTHTVIEAYTPGWVRTTGTRRSVSVTTGQTTAGVDFGHQPQFDYGQSPVPYPTVSSERGAVHGFVPGFYLGSNVDGESDGVHYAPARRTTWGIGTTMV